MGHLTANNGSFPHFYVGTRDQTNGGFYLIRKQYKAYWSDNGSDQICTMTATSQAAYGFKSSPGVSIGIPPDSATEASFAATVKHNSSTTTFTMNLSGNITP